MSMNQTPTIPLFRDYPRLEERLQRVSLATLPTPVEKLEQLGDAVGAKEVYIKRDDLSGAVYGGNKVRKLEFLLADALHAGAKEVITVGFAGSNHALATAIYARQLGLGCVSLLMPQVNAHYVRRNLLASQHYHARLCHYKNLPYLCVGLIAQLCRGVMKQGVLPKYIPGGGSCPLGLVGYVNAAFELRDQITEGLLPEPDLIYVTLGSMGTAAGLTLGLRAAGLKTRVISVRVIEERLAPPKQLRRLMEQTASLLSALDPDFPRVTLSGVDLFVRNDFMGEGYARFTEKACKAAHLIKAEAGIILNGTYTAKAFAALLDDAERGELRGKTVLFWNTYNSLDLSACAAGVDYHLLPEPFHVYFENDVQPLDREGPDR